MKVLAKPDATRARRPGGWVRAGRLVRNTLYAHCCLAFVLLLAAAGFYLRLAAGPLSLGDYAGRVSAALAERLGPGWTVSLKETSLELYGAKPAVSAAELQIRNPAGLTVVRAPYAVVSLDFLALLTGDFSPREIELRDLQLRGMIAKDGSLSFSSQIDAGPAQAGPHLPASPVPVPAPDTPSASVVSVAVASLLDPIVRPTGLIGGLDRASIIDARLTFVGPDGTVRAGFDDVDAVFERLDGESRRIDLSLKGERGAWRIAGRVKGGADRSAEIEAFGVPLADVMLLSGLSPFSAESDLKLSGRISTSFSGDRISRLDADIESNAGFISRPGQSRLSVDRLSAAAKWDEAAGTLRLDSIEAESGGAKARLSGQVSRAGAGWQMRLAGRDAVVDGVTGRDAAFRLGEVSAELSFADRGVTLDRARVIGDEIDMEATGTFEPAGAGGPMLRGTLEVRNTNARRLVRLWPDALNPDLRRYLAARLGGARVESLHLQSTLDAYDLGAAFSEAPMTDGSMDLRFVAKDVNLDVADGLPPLRGLTLEGRASGTKAVVAARDGFLDLPDGRRLGFPEASFVHKSLDKPGSPAQIGFRLAGGLDAFASFLRSPVFHDGGTLEIDPANVRGHIDVRATLPLVPGKIPALAQLKLSLAGTLSDVAIDKLPGRERLEGGNFTVAGEAGSLSLKGEARLGGSPATFDLQSPRPGSGELVVATVLDDAARARRNLPSGPALSGPVPAKVFIGFGPKIPVRVEVDLSRASIDGLVPGWVKPASRPGRLSFVLGEGETTELKDISVESGSVQIRGQAALGSGGLERADLSTFRLSPGDDLRAQLERIGGGGYRIALKGNNGDARPILKWLTGSPGRPPSRDGQDVDIELALNIMTGFNDEALTGVSAKVSSRGGEVRSAQFNGRFRNATIEAQLAKRDGGAPILALRSQDAGATLRFLDLYRRMIGGRLSIDARSGDGVQEGRITVEEFGLRNEPALARIVSTAAHPQSGGTDERGLAPVAQGDLDQVLFNRLTTDFRRTGSRIEYSDAVIYGAQVGFNLTGWVDHGRDRLDVSGTFVPAYMLNNAFSQLPVVGILLGGGQNEGLIAVDFRVAGSIGNPSVTINPLTAVAPGILRKLFGWMMPEGEKLEGVRPVEGTRQPRPRRSER